MFSFFQRKKNNQEIPFTTQYEVLTKYNLGLNKDGVMVGMCQPMSNLYASLLIQNKDPSTYLKDDKQFLNEAIIEENREGKAEEGGNKDVEHFAFQQNNIPHIDEEVSKNNLNTESFKALLQKSQHLLVTYPSTKDFAHEVYLGKESSNNSSCRFFDANLRGGERKGDCDKIIPQFVETMKKQYVDEDKGFYVGRSMGHS